MNSRDLEKRITNLEERLLKIENRMSLGEKSKSETKNLSIKEFILTKKPRDDTQKMLTVAYFLEKYENLASFNAKDLADGFRNAKEKIPANINDKANKIIASTGYFTETKEKKDDLKAWMLTNSGDNFVEQNMPSGQ